MLSIILLLFAFNSEVLTNYKFLGFIIILENIWLCIKTRKKPLLLFVFVVISLVNISAGWTDIFNRGLHVANWQVGLRLSSYSLNTAISLLLFSVIINLFFNPRTISNLPDFKEIHIDRKSNGYISIVCCIILLLIVMFGYGGKAVIGEYTSSSNVLIEYSGLIFLLGYFYSKNNKAFDYFSYIYLVIFLSRSLIRGDRSAASIILFMFVILYLPKLLQISKLLIFTILAIVGSNIIGVIRNMMNSPVDSIISQMVNRGLYIDTVSYAYYTSITFTSFHDIIGRGSYFFHQFIISIFLGTSNSEFASFSKYIREYDSFFFNRDGGFLSSWFYAWGGIIGVVIGTIVFSLLLLKVFRMRTSYTQLLTILFASYSIRWYLYNPINLVRVCILVFSILYLVSFFINKLLKRKTLSIDKKN